MHGAIRDLLLACFACVVLGLPDAVPTEHSHELMRGGAVLRGCGGVELANAMGRTMTQSCLVAPFSEFVAKALGGVGLALARYQVGQVSTRRHVNDGPQ